MATISVVCNNGLLNKKNLGVSSGNNKPLRRYTSVCYNSVFIPSVGMYTISNSLVLSRNKFRSLSNEKNEVPLFGFCVSCKSQFGLSCHNDIGPLRNGNRGNEQTHLRKRIIAGLRKRFSLRLRPRLRLLMIRLKRVSVRSMLNDFGMFLRKNIKRLTLYSSISIALGMFYLFLRLTALPSPKIVPYSDLIKSLQNDSVAKVLLEEGSRRIYYNAKSQDTENTQDPEDKLPVIDVPDENAADAVGRGGIASPTGQKYKVDILKKFSRRASSPEWQFCTRKIDHDEKFLLSLMREKGTMYSSAPQSVLMSMRSALITIISLWIPLTPLMWLLYRQLSAANSPARKRRPNNQMVTFDDVEGVDAAKIELMEIVSCLQGATNYQKLGAKLPRGVLLVGPPGTGKTLLARAVAGEAGVPFFSVSASEFVELFVGRGAARIRDLFNAARKCAPSIIFIDELDAVGGKRGRSFNDERDQTLNQLLTEMDGFESDMKVVVVAATNRPEALDPALCRPGRFSRKVLVGEPNEEGRKKILSVHLRGVPIEEDTDLICDLVASLTPGFVGADLANIVNEAALLAARRDGETVTREDIMEAVERAKFGINDRQLRPSAISKELGKLFPWIPSLMGKNVTGQEGLQGPLGYQTLS
ncbi:hypothetical protein JCGZ_25642 [Jatropha curcas]|uniref:AAA+ ATPase domain-containing protein n=1 Tax=Jatropha curcas TaxID=180498 RepID=A0A067JK38_JATCU|nr:probable inactive ATP-dependent zinc metalloprotease FTSHI 3, chloroplastic [Jatropha curcas]KDP24346.1 hypothetical protein JCGZ_25642 [Jatropha curcas]